MTMENDELSPLEAEDEFCYFYGDGRCLRWLAVPYPWSIKIGAADWLCTYPWKEVQGGEARFEVHLRKGDSQHVLISGRDRRRDSQQP